MTYEAALQNLRRKAVAKAAGTLDCTIDNLVLEELGPLLEAPSTTGGKLHITFGFSNGDDQGVAVSAYGSTANARVGKGINTKPYPVSRGMVSGKVWDITRMKERQGKGYARKPIPSAGRPSSPAPRPVRREVKPALSGPQVVEGEPESAWAELLQVYDI